MRNLPAVWLCSLSPLFGQTFVVDVGGGPGTNFTSLVVAVQTVPDGAVLVVRAGQYPGPITVVGKGLAILGEPGVIVHTTSFAAPVSVASLAPQQTFVLRNVQLSLPTGTFWPNTIHLQNNQGLLLLSDLSVAAAQTIQLSATQCSRLVLRDCTFDGRVQLVGGDTVFEACWIEQPVVGYPAIIMNGGRLQVLGGLARGGPDSTPFTAPATDLQNGADLRVLGGATMSAGPPASGGPPFGPAIGGNNSTVRLDPSTVLVGGVHAGVSATTTAMPDVTVDAPALGGTLTVALNGPVGHLGLLVAGTPAPLSQALGSTDALWLDASTFVAVVAGVPGPGAPVAASAVVPQAPGLLGLSFVWQGVTWSASAGWQTSNPALWVGH